MGDKVTIICSRCKVPVQGPEEPASDDIISCPECGVSDTFDKVFKEVEAWTVDMMEASLDKSLREVARGSSVLSVSGSPKSVGRYRFITTMKL